MNGEIVRTLRDELLGISQERFGELLGVTKLTVLRWENDQTEPGEVHRDAMAILREEILAASRVRLPAVLDDASVGEYLAEIDRETEAAIERFQERMRSN